MRPEFQIDIFWASFMRSNLAQRLSGVAVSGEISNFEWAPLILYGRQPFIWSPPRLDERCMVKEAWESLRGIRTGAKEQFYAISTQLTNWATQS